MKARANIFVSGHVQGVFYRDFTQTCALSHNLTGWVRNTGDGRVEVIAEGEKRDIEELVAELNEGTPTSIVEKVEVNWEDYTGEFSDFRIILAGFL